MLCLIIYVNGKMIDFTAVKNTLKGWWLPFLTSNVDEEGEVGGGNGGHHRNDGMLHGPSAAWRHLHQELQLSLRLCS